MRLSRSAVSQRIARIVSAVNQGDVATVEQAVLRVSHSRRWLAPLAFALGAFVMLFQGIKLLFSNWRLTLVQVLPAMWIWIAMFDLRLHVLHGRSVRVMHGGVVVAVSVAIIVITAASFFLNAAFAFAIAGTGSPDIRQGFERAQEHRRVVLGWGAAVGVLLALSTTVVARHGGIWFALSLSIVIAIMMLCYVAIPSRLLGVKPRASRRDRITASAVGGALGAIVCTPPYLIGRIGILMLGSRALFIPGIAFIAFGFTLQAGAAGAVKAVKMSTKLAGKPDP